MLRMRPGKFVSFTLCPLLLLSSYASAQENVAVEQAADAPGPMFELPGEITNFEQLIEFVEKLDGMDPPDKSQEAQEAHHRKVARTIVAAAEKLPTKDLSNEDAMQVVYFRLQGLQILKRLDEPKVSDRLTKAIDAALADERADIQAVGAKFMIESGFSQWAVWGDEDKQQLIDRIAKYISSRPAEASDVEMVMAVVDFLGDMNGEQSATRLMTDLIPHFKQSDSPQIQQSLTVLEGVNRRMQLPGNLIKLEGTLLDGSKLDWKAYRGKVVLVDFWATWCGPCRAEVPNILKMYEAYHDKGFEVLGISLDNTAEDATSYIKDTNIPWPTMFSDKPSEQGWRHPMAIRYGITGIPRAILVDREGKVVHMTARGPYLEQELRKLLGEPVARSRASEDNTLRPVSFSFSE